MKEPVLLVMAAGMGSRYGGLKQIDPVTPQGEIIMDFSLYDAMMAGFDRAVFVIRKEHEEAFRQMIDSRAGRYLDTEFVYQEMEDIPQGFSVPEGRTKPWGTCHAVLAARQVIDAPFCVINADDYYGPSAFHAMYDFLAHGEEKEEGDCHRYAMVGFQLEKTLSESGTVARGVCRVDENGYLQDVEEHTKIMSRGEVTAYTEDDGESWVTIPEGSTVSMNFWGFTPAMFREAEERFPEFLRNEVPKNPLKAEYFLPTVVQEQIDTGKARVQVLKSRNKWYGVTYREDKEAVSAAFRSMKDKGLYPEQLWHDVDIDNVMWKELKNK